ncbi:hypothetical protein BH24ACT2_BH24ACT2_16940 [soil metagenome]
MVGTRHRRTVPTIRSGYAVVAEPVGTHGHLLTGSDHDRLGATERRAGDAGQDHDHAQVGQGGGGGPAAGHGGPGRTEAPGQLGHQDRRREGGEGHGDQSEGVANPDAPGDHGRNHGGGGGERERPAPSRRDAASPAQHRRHSHQAQRRQGEGRAQEGEEAPAHHKGPAAGDFGHQGKQGPEGHDDGDAEGDHGVERQRAPPVQPRRGPFPRCRHGSTPPDQRGRGAGGDDHQGEQGPAHGDGLGEGVDGGDGAGPGEQGAHQGGDEGAEGQGDGGEADPTSVFVHHGAVEQGGGTQPGEQGSVLHRVPRPEAAPAQLDVGPMRSGQHAHGEDQPGGSGPAPD